MPHHVNACLVFHWLSYDRHSRKAPLSHQPGPFSRDDRFSAPFCSHTFFEWGFVVLITFWELVGHPEMIESVYMGG